MRFDDFDIRLITYDDAEAFYKLIQHNLDRLKDTFAGTVSKTRTIEETRVFIAAALKNNMQKLYYPFLIEEIETNKIVGFIDLKNINWDIPKTEIGYFIHKEYEGKGIAGNALKTIIGFCFDQLKMSKLFLRTTISNIGSQRVAEKNGFQKEGFVRRDYKTASGEIVDLLYYGLINNNL